MSGNDTKVLIEENVENSQDLAMFVQNLLEQMVNSIILMFLTPFI